MVRLGVSDQSGAGQEQCILLGRGQPVQWGQAGEYWKWTRVPFEERLGRRLEGVGQWFGVGSVGFKYRWHFGKGRERPGHRLNPRKGLSNFAGCLLRRGGSLLSDACLT